MHKIAVMGDRDSIYGFASVGLEIIPVDDLSTAGKVLRSLSDDYGIIYMTEALYAFLEKDLQPFEQKVFPAIIPIPGASGNTGLGIKRVKHSVERAVGSDIIFGGS